MTLRSKLAMALLAVMWTPFVALAQQPLKIVTYNIHGGHGNLEYNLQLFKELLHGDEHVLCLQEIKPGDWQTVQGVFPEFPHTQIVWRQTTDELGPFEQPQREASALLAKLPIASRSERLIQIDPAGDLWERKAGFVRLQANDNSDDTIFVAHYHNTYNFDENDFAAEQTGLARFRAIGLELMGENSLTNPQPYVLAGDFNLLEDKVAAVLHDAPQRFGVWRDHIATNRALLATQRLDATGRDISDHDAVVAVLDYTVKLPASDVGGEVIDGEPVAQAGAPALEWILAPMWVGWWMSRRKRRV